MWPNRNIFKKEKVLPQSITEERLLHHRQSRKVGLLGRRFWAQTHGTVLTVSPPPLLPAPALPFRPLPVAPASPLPLPVLSPPSAPLPLLPLRLLFLSLSWISSPATEQPHTYRCSVTVVAMILCFDTWRAWWTLVYYPACLQNTLSQGWAVWAEPQRVLSECERARRGRTFQRE